MRVVAAMLVALAFGSAAPSAALPAGLRGVVMRGPTSPVCGEDDPCEAPAAGVVLRFSRAGAVVARAVTGKRGGYEVRLRPGTYTVTTPGPRRGTGLTPRVVRVRGTGIQRVDFHLDTGIQ